VAAAALVRASAAQAQAAVELPSLQRATECRPCEVALEPGGEVWRVAVNADTVRGGGGRSVRALRVARGARAPVWLTLAPPVSLEAGEEFAVGVVTLGAGRAPAVFFLPEPGTPNARGYYWSVAANGRAASLGAHPVLVSAAGGRICSYERGGEGGAAFTQTELRLHDDRLRPVRELRVERAGRGGGFRVVRRSWDGAGTPRTRVTPVTRAAAERLAGAVSGPCPGSDAAGARAK
jgi:hypothetical protein